MSEIDGEPSQKDMLQEVRAISDELRKFQSVVEGRLEQIESKVLEDVTGGQFSRAEAGGSVRAAFLSAVKTE